MSKITRTDASKVLAKAVEYHNFVYLAGITADDTSQDVAGQTTQILATIDAPARDARHRQDPAAAGADLGQRHPRPGRHEQGLVAWLPEGGAPARACVEAKMADPRLLVEIMITACK